MPRPPHAAPAARARTGECLHRYKRRRPEHRRRSSASCCPCRRLDPGRAAPDPGPLPVVRLVTAVLVGPVVPALAGLVVPAAPVLADLVVPAGAVVPAGPVVPVVPAVPAGLVAPAVPAVPAGPVAALAGPVAALAGPVAGLADPVAALVVLAGPAVLVGPVDSASRPGSHGRASCYRAMTDRVPGRAHDRAHRRRCAGRRRLTRRRWHGRGAHSANPGRL